MPVESKLQSLVRWACVGLTLFLMLGAALARDDDGPALTQECAIDWQERLTGKTIFGQDVNVDRQFTEYFMPDGRVLWRVMDSSFIEDDRWSIENCEQLCWELQNYTDWCVRMVETPVGFDAYHSTTDMLVFNIIIAGEGDRANLQALLERQNQARQ